MFSSLDNPLVFLFYSTWSNLPTTRCEYRHVSIGYSNGEFRSTNDWGISTTESSNLSWWFTIIHSIIFRSERRWWFERENRWKIWMGSYPLDSSMNWSDFRDLFLPIISPGSYSRPHLQRWFNLFDRNQTGFIKPDQ